MVRARRRRCRSGSGTARPARCGRTIQNVMAGGRIVPGPLAPPGARAPECVPGESMPISWYGGEHWSSSPFSAVPDHRAVLVGDQVDALGCRVTMQRFVRVFVVVVPVGLVAVGLGVRARCAGSPSWRPSAGPERRAPGRSSVGGQALAEDKRHADQQHGEEQGVRWRSGGSAARASGGGNRVCGRRARYTCRSETGSAGFSAGLSGASIM